MTTTCPATSAAPDEVRALLADRDTLGATLDRFAAAFTTLSKLLGAAPDIARVDRLRDPELLAEWPLDDADSARATTLLAEYRLAKEDLSRIRRDYGRLFVGPGRMIAPPYESVYRSDAGPGRRTRDDAGPRGRPRA
ncbi:molecular chaperone TorD family protein [Georgenia sp. 10Sc9-8]|uniref:Molecular chaperone TorD family protein n=1 Tax=Georgenia halotolerans TaxID=3028317 RepID=A0ABT5TYF3_9MICO|nr:molecular chaperone TorD family protein [Georgenia halotolerans]